MRRVAPLVIGVGLLAIAVLVAIPALQASNATGSSGAPGGGNAPGAGKGTVGGDPTAVSGAAGAGSTTSATGSAGGELAFSTESADLGRVPLDTPAPFRFEMRNVGTGPVKITRGRINALEGC